MVDISEYKVGIILSIEDCGKSAGKPLKSCHVNVGDPTNPLTVVTSAPNVREGSRYEHTRGRVSTFDKN